MIQAGTYRARATGGALGFTSGGAEQVAVALELLDHPGQSITWYGYFTEKTTGETFKALRACGWEGDDLSELTGLTDNEVTIVVQHETDKEGKQRARVRWINSQGGLALKNSMAPDAAKAFAAKMRGAVIAAGKSDPAAKVQPKRPPSTNGATREPGSDDGPPDFDEDGLPLV